MPRLPAIHRMRSLFGKVVDIIILKTFVCSFVCLPRYLVSCQGFPIVRIEHVHAHSEVRLFNANVLKLNWAYITRNKLVHMSW